MATAHEIRNLIEQTITGTRRRRVPEEVKEQVGAMRSADAPRQPPGKRLAGRRASRPASSARGVGRRER
jgi:hypothetical protein